jgi:membrane-bound lytic murein transglycosylase D
MMSMLRWLIGLTSVLFLAGCASVGLLGSKTTASQQDEAGVQAIPAQVSAERPSAINRRDHLPFSSSTPDAYKIITEDPACFAALWPKPQYLHERALPREAIEGPGEFSALLEASVALGIEEDPRIEFFVRYFREDARQNFELGLARSTKYLPMMREIFQEEGLPEQLVYLALIESNFNPRAYSRRRAVGIWQFMAGTGRKFGLRINWWVDERRDPVKSTRAAASYLKYLYEMFGEWDLAIAGYNAGEGTIERCLRRREADNFWGLCKYRDLKRETKNFVPKFLAASRIATDPEGHGFVGVQFEEPWKFDVVAVSEPVDLETIARLVDASEKEILELNPQLRRWSTPPGRGVTELRVPKGTVRQFAAGLVKLAPSQRNNIKVHTVRNGESLWLIARRYGSRVDLIQSFNRLPSASRVRAGSRLMIPLPTGEGQETIPMAEKRDIRNVPPISSSPEDEPDQAGDGFIVHHVKKGDTLWSISRKYGVRIADILRWNGLGSHHIRPGDAIRLIQRET